MALVPLVGPQAVQNLRYTRCTGAELETAKGGRSSIFSPDTASTTPDITTPTSFSRSAETISMVLKVAPPLIISEPQIDYFIESVHDVVAIMHSSGTFWSDAIKPGQRAISA
jgi:adenosylmethionine-8-amino-7-oxononanoate aminotransferase